METILNILVWYAIGVGIFWICYFLFSPWGFVESGGYAIIWPFVIAKFLWRVVQMALAIIKDPDL